MSTNDADLDKKSGAVPEAVPEGTATSRVNARDANGRRIPQVLDDEPIHTPGPTARLASESLDDLPLLHVPNPSELPSSTLLEFLPFEPMPIPETHGLENRDRSTDWAGPAAERGADQDAVLDVTARSAIGVSSTSGRVQDDRDSAASGSIATPRLGQSTDRGDDEMPLVEFRPPTVDAESSVAAQQTPSDWSSSRDVAGTRPVSVAADGDDEEKVVPPSFEAIAPVNADDRNNTASIGQDVPSASGSAVTPENARSHAADQAVRHPSVNFEALNSATTQMPHASTPAIQTSVSLTPTGAEFPVLPDSAEHSLAQELSDADRQLSGDAHGLEELVTRLDNEMEASYGTLLHRDVGINVTAQDASAAKERHLLVRINHARWAFPSEAALEVENVPPITRVPNVPRWVMGVANIRGDIVSMVDFKALLGFGPTPTTEIGRIVVTKSATQNVVVGLVVEEVNGFLRVDREELSKPTGLREHLASSYLLGVCEHKGDLVSLLDLGRFLDSRHVRQFEAS